MSIAFVNETMRDGCNFAKNAMKEMTKPSNLPQDFRKACFWLGSAGVITVLASKVFAAITTTEFCVGLGVSASLVTAGVSGMSLFLIPSAAFTCWALAGAMSDANIVWVVRI